MRDRVGSSTAAIVPLIAALALAGCAGYAGDVAEIRSALRAGDKPRALEMANAVLDVEEDHEYPRKVGGDNALLVLERATIKQGLGRFPASTTDFQVADQHLELLDLKNDTAGNIGKWLFSDDVTVYKAPPHEKLLLNTLNMLNYLAIGNLEEARVEARRLRVMRRHLVDAYSAEEARLGLGSYLAGFAFEMSGRHEDALRSYDEALAAEDYPSLAAPIRRLAGCSSYRSERIEALLPAAPDPAPPPPDPAPVVAADPDAGPWSEPATAAPEPPVAPAPPPVCRPRSEETGTLLVVTGIGLAPHKQATRIPIGAALVIAGHVMYGPGLGMGDSAKAQELAAKGLLKWVNFPRMTKTRPRYKRVAVAVDGEPVETELGANVTSLVIESWDRIKGTLMAAAIVRMIARAVAGEATQRAAEGGGAAGGLALLAGLAVEGALTAADTPDTRSWVTLPSHVVISRAELPAGRHKVLIRLEGAQGSRRIERQVDLPPGGFAVVSVASMR
jgi:hypothetical protein